MPRPRPDKLHDELDALLDGRPVELTGELAPLAEAAGALQAELAALQLDPEVADRHLERVLEGSATVVTMPPRQPTGWELRRRVAAIALAAALVLAPATVASAAALPGQAMYPFKRAIEQLRLASVQWSPSGEAAERTRLADERLGELQQLAALQMFNQLPTAIEALEQAVVAARVAVEEAEREGVEVGRVARKLNAVKDQGARVVGRVVATVDQSLVPAGTREAIKQAAQKTTDVLPIPREVGGGTKNPPGTGGGSSAPTTQPPVVTNPPANPTPSTGTPPADPATTNPTATTVPPAPQTTEPAPPTTTEAPPTTVLPAEPPGSKDKPKPEDKPGADGRAGDPVPDPTVPAP